MSVWAETHSDLQFVVRIDPQTSAVMKAVIPNVPEPLLDWRKRTGAERWDEMWEGVLHMRPTPNRDHQDL